MNDVADREVDYDLMMLDEGAEEEDEGTLLQSGPAAAIDTDPKKVRKESDPSKAVKSGRHRIKLDYGWKTLLRGMRQCLREGMESSNMFQGRHHWND